MEADVTKIAPTSVLLLAGTATALAGPLHDAARDGDLAEVKAQIASGVDMNSPGDHGDTPLILAILNDHDDVAMVLIEQGADIQGRNRGGFTPLHAAAYVDDLDAAELLVATGADVGDRQNKAGVSPLSVAAEEGHVAVARALIEHGADVEAVEQNGYTSLSRALWRGHKDIAALLQQSGAECQQEDILGGPVYAECVAGRP